MDQPTVISAITLVVGTIVGALFRFTMAQVELRTATAERRIDAQATTIGVLSEKLAVVTAQHDGTTRELRAINQQLARISAHLLGRASTHEREGDEQ